MTRPDILFVHAGTNKTVFEVLADEFAAVEPPFTAALAAGYVRDKGYKVELLDANALGLSFTKTAEEAITRNPRAICMIAMGSQPSASSHLMSAIHATCNEIKGRSDIPIVLAGIHPSTMYERTLREVPCDAVIRGEVYAGLIGLASTQGKLTPKIPGLAYKEGEDIVCNRTAPLLMTNGQGLEAHLSSVAWDLLPEFKNYRAHNWHAFENINERSPYASLYTSLGCPFTCSFCCINAEFATARTENPSAPSKGIRYWNPKWVGEQLEFLVNKGVRHVKFIDEMFVLDENHYCGIAKEIKERGLDTSLNIWAYARVDTVKSERALNHLKSAGINWLALGIESMSKTVRTGAKKRFTNEDVIASVKRVHNAGMHIVGNYIFGLPDDTRETMRETLQLAQELNTAWFNGYTAFAYPGAQLYELMRQKKVPLPGDLGIPGGWTAYSHHARDSYPLPTDTLTSAEVIAFRDFAFNAYFSNPHYLEYIRTTFGDGVVAHLQRMQQKTLKRTLLNGEDFRAHYARKGVSIPSGKEHAYVSAV